MNEKKMDEFKAMANESKCCIMLIDNGQGYSQVVNGRVRNLALLLAVSIKRRPELIPVIEAALEVYRHVENSDNTK